MLLLLVEGEVLEDGGEAESSSDEVDDDEGKKDEDGAGDGIGDCSLGGFDGFGVAAGDNEFNGAKKEKDKGDGADEEEGNVNDTDNGVSEAAQGGDVGESFVSVGVS